MSDDGTQTFTCKIPKYYINPLTNEKVINPRWESAENGVLAENVRILKVFVKKPDEQVNVYPFIIDKITDSRDSHFSIYKSIEASGMAFAELGKVGYKIEFDQALVEREMEALANQTENEDEKVSALIEPTIDYWLKKLIPAEYDDNGKVIKWLTPWCYEVCMDWRYYADGAARESNKIYDDSYCEDWEIEGTGDAAKLVPKGYKSALEKQRIVTCKNSNKYNITQTIAETFEVFCRYEYKCDERGHFIGTYTEGEGANAKVWTGKKIVFYNRAIKTENPLVVDYQKNLDTMTRTSDSTDIFTKLYITPIEAPSMTNGYVTIADTTANPLRDDFILNFDYLDSLGAITDYQHQFIGLYKTSIAEHNRKIEAALDQAEIYRIEVNELKAEKAFHDKAKESAETTASDYEKQYHNLEAQGPVIKDKTNALSATFVPYDTDSPWHYFSLHLQGVDATTVEVFIDSSYTSGSTTSGKPLGSYMSFDEFKDFGVTSPNNIYILLDNTGYPDKIFTKQVKDASDNNINIFLDDSMVYVGLTYTPANKYKDQYDTYVQLQKDEEAQSKALDEKITTVQASYDSYYNIYLNEDAKKKALNEKLERIMGPALREGYWTPDNYEDYSIASKVKPSFDNEENPILLRWFDPLATDYRSYFIEGSNQTYWQYPYLRFDASDVVMTSAAPHKLILHVMAPFEAQSYSQYPKGWYFFSTTSGLTYYIYLKKDYPSGTYFKFDADEHGWARFGSKEPTETEWDYKGTSGDWSWTTSQPTSVETKDIKKFELFNGAYQETFYYGAHFHYAAYDIDKDNQALSAVILLHIDRGNTYLDNYEPENLIWTYHFDAASKPEYIWPYIVKADGTKVLRFSNFQKLGQGTTAPSNCAFYPRFVINELNVQAGASTFSIKNTRTDKLLTKNEDYFITYSSGKPHITLRPTANNTLADIINFNSPYEITYNVSQANELLYLDAVDVAYDNSIPRFTYDLKIANLPHEFADIELGSMLYINDYALGVHAATGYVSEIEWALDAPQSDSVSVQNYKTKFEDLFSTIVAESEAMKTNKTAYNLAARAFTQSGSMGILSSNNLSSTITSNNSYWLNWSACGVEITPDQGIILTNRTPYANGVYGQVILQGGGIFLSNSVDANGNRIWSAAITPEGINASLIRAGQLNTEKIMIYAGNNTAFMWDAEGIFAYKREDETPSLNEYVKFSQYGVQVVDDTLLNWEAGDKTNGHNAIVSLNWNGLTLRNNKGVKTLEIDRGNEGGGSLKIVGSMQSNPFTPGFAGQGWRIDEKGDAEFNNIYVRGTISASVFEYEEVSAVGGQMYIAPTLIANAVKQEKTQPAMYYSDENGNKINITTPGAEGNYLAFKLNFGFGETEENGGYKKCGRVWRENDIITLTCTFKTKSANGEEKSFEIKNGKAYFATLKDSNGDSLLITTSKIYGANNDSSVDTYNFFYNEEGPVAASEVQINNNTTIIGEINCIYLGTQNEQGISQRRGLFLTAMADSGPYIDVWDDEKSIILESGTTPPKVRLGCLDDLGTISWRDKYDSSCINSITPSGYGLYSDNVYLTGAIYATSGRIGSLSIDEVATGTGQLSLKLTSAIDFIYTKQTSEFNMSCEVYFGNKRITKRSDLPDIYQIKDNDGNYLTTFKFSYQSDANDTWNDFSQSSPSWSKVDLFDANGNIIDLTYTKPNTDNSTMLNQYRAKLVLNKEILGQTTVLSDVKKFSFVDNGQKGDQGGKGDQGIQGESGTPGRNYYITSSANSISIDMDGISPQTITLTAQYADGTNTPIDLTTGTWVITLLQADANGTPLDPVEITPSVTGNTCTFNVEVANASNAKRYEVVLHVEGKQVQTISIPFTIAGRLAELGKIKNGEVIVNDGKIYANALTAGAVTAGTLSAGAITTGAIASNSTLYLVSGEYINDPPPYVPGEPGSWKPAENDDYGEDSVRTWTGEQSWEYAVAITNGYQWNIWDRGNYDSCVKIGNDGVFIRGKGVFEVDMSNFKVKPVLEVNLEDNDPIVLQVYDKFFIRASGDVTANSITLNNASIVKNGYVGAAIIVSPSAPAAPGGAQGEYLWLRPVGSTSSGSVSNVLEYETTTSAAGWTDRTWIGGDNAKTATASLVSGEKVESYSKTYRYTVTFPIYISNYQYGGTNVAGNVYCILNNGINEITSTSVQTVIASKNYNYRDVNIALTFDSPTWLGNADNIIVRPRVTNLSGKSSGNILNSSTPNQSIKVICEILE